MKPNITNTYHYILFLGLALLLAPAKMIRPCSIPKEVRTEKQQQVITEEATTGLLHGEMLFRF